MIRRLTDAHCDLGSAGPWPRAWPPARPSLRSGVGFENTPTIGGRRRSCRAAPVTAPGRGLTAQRGCCDRRPEPGSVPAARCLARRRAVKRAARLSARSARGRDLGRRPAARQRARGRRRHVASGGQRPRHLGRAELRRGERARDDRKRRERLARIKARIPGDRSRRRCPSATADTAPSIVAFALSTTQPGGPAVVSPLGRPAATRSSPRARAMRSPDWRRTRSSSAAGPKSDRLGLDPDGDGFACGWDPRPFRTARCGEPMDRPSPHPSPNCRRAARRACARHWSCSTIPRWRRRRRRWRGSAIRRPRSRRIT